MESSVSTHQPELSICNELPSVSCVIMVFTDGALGMIYLFMCLKVFIEHQLCVRHWLIAGVPDKQGKPDLCHHGVYSSLMGTTEQLIQ